MVVIGGGIARAGDLLFEPLRKELDALEWRPGGEQVQVAPAQLGEFAGAIGAAWMGQRKGRLAEEGHGDGSL